MSKFSFASLVLLCWCFSAYATNAGIKPGDTPPDSLGTTLDGHTVSLASLHGKVVVISFWATWCGYCMKEMPVLAGLQSLATKRNLPLQVVAVDSKEDRDTFFHAARLLRSRLPQLLISWDRHGNVGEPYGANKIIPVMVLLHRDGTVADVHVGYDDGTLDQLVVEINGLLTEPAPPAVATTP